MVDRYPNMDRWRAHTRPSPILYVKLVNSFIPMKCMLFAYLRYSPVRPISKPAYSTLPWHSIWQFWNVQQLVCMSTICLQLNGVECLRMCTAQSSQLHQLVQTVFVFVEQLQIDVTGLVLVEKLHVQCVVAVIACQNMNNLTIRLDEPVYIYSKITTNTQEFSRKIRRNRKIIVNER